MAVGHPDRAQRFYRLLARHYYRFSSFDDYVWDMTNKDPVPLTVTYDPEEGFRYFLFDYDLMENAPIDKADILSLPGNPIPEKK